MNRQLKILLLCLILNLLTLGGEIAFAAGKPSRKEVTTTEGFEFFVGWLKNGNAQSNNEDESKNLHLSLTAVARANDTIYVETAKETKEYLIAADSKRKGYVTIELDPDEVLVDLGSEGEEESVVDKGVRVYTKCNVPFFLFAANKDGSTAEGSSTFDVTQVYPIETLGKEYVVQTNDIDRYANQFIVVATDDDTNVTIQLSADASQHKKGSPIEITLQKREVYLVTSSVPNGNFTGTTVCASKPVALFCGSQSVLIPNIGGMTDDHAYEQSLPLQRWGKQFIVPMTAFNTTANELQITALHNETEVVIEGLNSPKTQTLEAFKTLKVNLTSVNPTEGVVSVTATKPVSLYLYTTSAGRNPYTDPETGDYHLIGDPSHVLIPPLNMLTDTLLFATYSNPDLGAELTHFVNLWARESAASSVKMDGKSVADQFTASLTVDGKKYKVARIEVTSGAHIIGAKNKSLGGLVYGLNDGQAYINTVGFNFQKEKDSLFVNAENVSDVRHAKYIASDDRYYLAENHNYEGYVYQDSIFICDTTKLTFPAKIADAYEKVVWEITPTKPNPNREGTYFEPVEEAANETSTHELEHQFKLLPPDKEKNREPFEDFELKLLVYHNMLLCENSEPDSLKAIVRVLRQFADTTWRIVCVTDTIHFFEESEYFVENVTGKGNNAKTIYQFNKTNLSKDIVAFKKGDNTFTRKYSTKAGCDSLVTLKIYGCDSTYYFLDTTACETDIQQLSVHDPNGTLRFNYNSVKDSIIQQDSLLKLMQKNDTLLPYTKTFKHALKTSECLVCKETETKKQELINRYLAEHFKQFGTNFAGCPDTFEMRLTIMPRLFYPSENPLQTDWCIKGNAPFEWKRADGRLIKKIDKNDPHFDPITHIGYFDTVFYYKPCPECPTGDCVMEKDSLILHKAEDTQIEKHICQNESYTHDFGGGLVKTYNGWNFSTKAQLYPNAAKDTTAIIDVNGQCTYDSRLVLYVHPAYLKDDHLNTEKTKRDTTCFALTEYYSWKNHTTHVLWSQTESKYVRGDTIPRSKAGEFVYIDSLKTKTCTECADGACDSIWRLTLIVGEEYHKVDSFGLCSNDVLEYKWGNETYYFYGSKYDGDKKTKAKATLVGDEWLNETCNGTKTYERVFHGQSRYKCDSIHTLKIHLDKTEDVKEVTAYICETETYDFLGKTVGPWAYDHTNKAKNTHVLRDTSIADCNCKKYEVHTVYVRPVYTLTETPDTVCQWLKADDDQYYTWTQHPRSSEPRRKIFMRNITTGVGDSVWTDRISLDTLAGTYELVDAVKTKTCPDCHGGGCDSVTSRLLTIIPTYDILINDTVSDKSTKEWDGILFVGPKATVPAGNTLPIVTPAEGENECAYTKTYHTKVDALGNPTGKNACDSIVTYHVLFGETFFQMEYDWTCENCAYTWSFHSDETGQSKTIIINDVPKAGFDSIYYDSLKTVLNFDSVYAIQLTSFPTKYNTASGSTCQGNTYAWDGHPGQKKHLYLVNDNGTTTAITTDYVFADYGTFIIRDSMLTDTVFIHPESGAKIPVHCDSIWELTLVIHPTYSWQYNKDRVTQQLSLCSNETHLWSNRLWVGPDYDAEAHPALVPAKDTPDYDSIVYIAPEKVEVDGKGYYYLDSIANRGLKTTRGCDSISFVRINISQIVRTVEVHHIGDNDSTWSFGGRLGGTFIYDGKTKITRADLVSSDTIDYSDPTRREIKKYFFIDSLKTGDGCDWIWWDSVYIHPSYRFDTTAVVCSMNDWSWRPNSPNAERFHNINEKESGTYYDSLQATVYGIDSVFVLHLFVEPQFKQETWSRICKIDTLYWQGFKIYYDGDEEEVRTATYKTGALCDSIFIKHVNYYEFYHFPTETPKFGESVCRYDELTWISPGETKPHTERLRGENGEKFDKVPTDTLGWITLYDSLITTSGCDCDSTYTLRYLVKPAYRYYDTATICSNETYSWRGLELHSDIATQIDTTDRFTTAEYGCDSIYFLTLYINQAYDIEEHTTICADEQEFYWEEHNMNEWLRRHYEEIKDTLPFDTILVSEHLAKGQKYPSATQCDSVRRLYLHVTPVRTTEWNDTICEGETYLFNERELTEIGVYTENLLTQFGCDSVAKVHLHVVQPTAFSIETASVCADNNTLEMRFAFDPLKGFPPQSVRIVYDSLAKACGYPDDTLTLAVSENTVEIPMPTTDELYPRPNHYTASVLFDNGTCTELEKQKAVLSFTVNYPSWLLEQHWADAIAILASDYNGGYSFSAYQWYKNGQILHGETKPYLFAPDYLEVGAEYNVELTRDGEDFGILTCAIVAKTADSTLVPQKPYVSVVPTFVAKENPIVYIMCSQYGGNYAIYNPYGTLIDSGRFEPDDHNTFEVQLPAVTGVYLFELNQENGERRSIKVIVN